MSIKVDKNSSVPVILSNKYGEAILAGRKFKGETISNISIESTAEVFLLRSSIFFGLTILDDKELSNRIRNHQRFPELVKKLKRNVEISSCPMSHECSFLASLIADNISKEIEIKDLVEVK